MFWLIYRHRILLALKYQYQYWPQKSSIFQTLLAEYINIYSDNLQEMYSEEGLIPTIINKFKLDLKNGEPFGLVYNNRYSAVIIIITATVFTDSVQ